MTVYRSRKFRRWCSCPILCTAREDFRRHSQEFVCVKKTTHEQWANMYVPSLTPSVGCKLFICAIGSTVGRKLTLTISGTRASLPTCMPGRHLDSRMLNESTLRDRGTTMSVAWTFPCSPTDNPPHHRSVSALRSHFQWPGHHHFISVVPLSIESCGRCLIRLGVI